MFCSFVFPCCSLFFRVVPCFSVLFVFFRVLRFVWCHSFFVVSLVFCGVIRFLWCHSFFRAVWWFFEILILHYADSLRLSQFATRAVRKISRCYFHNTTTYKHGIERGAKSVQFEYAVAVVFF